jgi:hypothetical protein
VLSCVVLWPLCYLVISKIDKLLTKRSAESGSQESVEPVDFSLVLRDNED